MQGSSCRDKECGQARGLYSFLDLMSKETVTHESVG